MDSFTLKKNIFIAAKPEVIFDALTSSKEIVKYYPLQKVTSEWQVDADILFEGEIDGHPFRDHGLIEVLSRPVQFKYRYWSDNHGTERIAANYINISYTLSPEREGTWLQLEQGNLPSEAMYQMMIPIWDALLSSLKKFAEKQVFNVHLT